MSIRIVNNVLYLNGVATMQYRSFERALAVATAYIHLGRVYATR